MPVIKKKKKTPYNWSPSKSTPYEDRMSDRSRMKSYGFRPKGNTLGYDWRKEMDDFTAESRRIGKPHSEYRLKKKKKKKKK